MEISDGYRIFDRKSKEYKLYLENTVKEFNANGKKTVLLSCDAYFPVIDGVVNVLDNIAVNLSEEYNVLALAPDFKGKVYMKDYPVVGVKSCFSKKLGYQIALPSFTPFAKRLLKKLKIDIIHCHSPFFIGNYMLKLHKSKKIPMVSTFHSQYKQDFIKSVGDGLLTKLLLKRIMKVFNGSDEVWTMHSASKATLLSYGYKGKVLLFPNGTSYSSSGNYEEERISARREFALKEGEKLFIFVGRLVAQKNILFIADVLNELKKGGVDFKMIFAGDGPDRDKLEAMIKEHNLGGCTALLGNVSDKNTLMKLYAAADLFLFPSMYDVSSIVQIEAASRKTPVAFAEGSVTSCTVTDGRNGYIFPCEVTKFANGVKEAVKNEEQLKYIGEKAFEELYVTWEKAAEKMAEEYDFVITQNRLIRNGGNNENRNAENYRGGVIFNSRCGTERNYRRPCACRIGA